MRQEIKRVIESVVEANNDKKLQIVIEGNKAVIKLLCEDNYKSIYYRFITSMNGIQLNTFYVSCRELVIEEKDEYMWLWFYDENRNLTANGSIWYKDMVAGE